MDLIIGAGITGLSYAARTQNEYLILEQENEIGGFCRTIRKHGFIWDYAGHFFHFQHPELRDFVMQRISASEVLTVQKRTQIYYKGRMVDFPFQMNIHQLEQQEFIDCLYDLFTTIPTAPVSTFKQMLYAKFGRSIAEKFLIPYNSKLYATDLDSLDPDAMGRFFPYADREQIVRNFRHTEGAPASYNSTFIYPREGCMRIVQSVASHVDNRAIALGESVEEIFPQRHTVITSRGRTLRYDRLISTMPLPTLLGRCHIPFDQALFSANKVLVFNLGFDGKGPEQRNCWIYYPDPELVFYRVGFYDNILGQDRTSLYVEIGFPQGEDKIDVDNLLRRTLADLRRVGAIADQQLIAHTALMMNPAYAHITSRSEEEKLRLFNELESLDIYSIGRYGAWRYCSLEDNIYEAFALADRLHPQQP